MTVYHVIAGQLHEAVEKAMWVLNANAPVIEGENQDRMDQLKDTQIIIEVSDVSRPTISYAMIGDLFELVKYDLEFSEGVRDWEPEWEYTYHGCFGPYLQSCIDELKRNNATRRAVLPIAGPASYGNPHPPCLQVIEFRIIRGKLETTAIFRSNDGCKAFAMNAFAIIRLAHRIAEAVGVKVGGYTHYANSFHCYSRDFDELAAYCERFRKDHGLYYEYDEYLEVFDQYADVYREKCRERKEHICGSESKREGRKNGRTGKS